MQGWIPVAAPVAKIMRVAAAAVVSDPEAPAFAIGSPDELVGVFEVGDFHIVSVPEQFDMASGVIETFSVGGVGAGFAQVVAADGGRVRDLVKGGMFSAMVWTPDGKNLIYTTVERGALTSAKYWIVPFGGGEPRRLTVPLDRPGMLSIDPSGRRIAITAAGRWTELWVLQNLNTSRSRPTP